MKRLTTIVLTLALIFPLIFAIALIPQWLEIKPCLETKEISVLNSCLDKLPPLIPYLTKANQIINSDTLSSALTLYTQISPLLPERNYLLGIDQDHPTTYLILLQNDKELRTNGGYFGSYAVITATEAAFSFRFQDIGVPDGALNGHVEPPSPVQRSFQNGWFKLRDSDWDPNWPTTATAIRWFLDKGREINPDILVTLSLSDIKKVIDITGPFEVPEYNITITSDNVYTLLQNQAEVGFFPGSTSKRDALSATAKALIKHFEGLESEKKLAIATILMDALNQQNILLNSKNTALQNTFKAQNWAGQWEPTACKTANCLSDTLAVIEANMGANKANCCVNRLSTHQISREDNLIHHTVIIEYDNTSPLENPDPPRFYGGNYINYIRFYLPKSATDVTVATTPTLPTTLLIYPKPFPMFPNDYLDINEDKYGFKEVGFFHTTKSLSQSSITVSYDLPIGPNQPYELNILKQHGLQESPQQINLFGVNYKTNLESNFSFSE